MSEDKDQQDAGKDDVAAGSSIGERLLRFRRVAVVAGPAVAVGAAAFVGYMATKAFKKRK